MSPLLASAIRLYAIRDLMRMEMPERLEDVVNQDGTNSDCLPSNILNQYIVLTEPSSGNPQDVQISAYFGLSSGTLGVPEPALHRLYYAMCSNPTAYGRQPIAATPMAKMLYMTVMTGNAEAREQFQQNEITVDSDGWPMFVDGWGRPIVWLRWRQGAVTASRGCSAR